MTPSEANFFVVDEVTPRVYGKKLDDVVQGDWIRALSKPWATLDTARRAIQKMVDAGTPFKVSSFVIAMKKIKPAGDAEITKPVLLFSIRITTEHMYNNKPWSYTKGFYGASQKKIPQPETIQFQANYWATKLKGIIEWTEEFSPIQESDIPF